jgi:molybdopterin molybdotransferase
MKDPVTSYTEALGLVLENIKPLSEETVPLAEATDRVLTRDLYAAVDSPSVNASLKDGYAVMSKDLERARKQNPVALRLTGSVAAGASGEPRVTPGTAVRVLTGARLPEGADAVLPDELSTPEGDVVLLRSPTEPGRNILPKGFDVTAGNLVLAAGSVLTPGMAGLLAAAGHGEIPVFRRVKAAVLATGDEVVAPGRPLSKGKLFASNMVTLSAWCRRYHMDTETEVVPDDWGSIRKAIEKAVDSHDAILTSGGAWFGDRDMVSKVLDQLGWKKDFHRARMGPGKAVGFGILRETPVFILPGGPPSNLIAFLEIALPGLLKLGGRNNPCLPSVTVTLPETLTGMKEWTQFIFGRIDIQDDKTWFIPLEGKSRLRSMAEAEGIVSIPEGIETLPEGSEVKAQVLF